MTAACNLYVSDYGNDQISKISPDGPTVSLFAILGFIPYGLVFDGSGNLYATGDNNQPSRSLPHGR